MYNVRIRSMPYRKSRSKSMGVNSEYGKLRKVLLCKPDYFKWLPINPVAKKALAGGQTFCLTSAPWFLILDTSPA